MSMDALPFAIHVDRKLRLMIFITPNVSKSQRLVAVRSTLQG
jgi:hypothetical protein